MRDVRMFYFLHKLVVNKLEGRTVLLKRWWQKELQIDANYNEI